MRTPRTIRRAIPLVVATLLGLTACGAPVGPAPTPTPTPTAEAADDCTTAVAAMRTAQTTLVTALEPAGEAGNTENRSATLDPVVAELQALGESADEAELAAAVRGVADTLGTFRTALHDIAVIRSTAQDAEAIVAVTDNDPQIIQAATDVLTAANVALTEVTAQVAPLGTDFAAGVETVTGLCA
jgi:hypothetical protein